MPKKAPSPQLDLKLSYDYIKTAELVPYARNSRKHTKRQIDQVATSISQFGFLAPVVIRGNEIVAGHCRVLAAQKLKLDSVPCVRADHLTDAQMRGYVLVDNRLTEVSEWDNDLLKAELEALINELPMDEMGFSEDELTALDIDLSEALSGSDPLCDEDEAPEAPEDPVTQLGDIWTLGAHRLMCGDSTDPDDIETLLKGERATFCFTSPPYSDQREYNGRKDLSVSKLAKFLHAPCDLYVVNLGMQRKGGEVFPYWDEYIKAAKEYGHKFLSWNIWDRFSAMSVGQQTAMFPIEHEWIFVFGKTKKLNCTVPNVRAGEIPISTNRDTDGALKRIKPKGVRDCRPIGTVTRQFAIKSNTERAAGHPAMFPVAFPESYIEACTDESDLVYEPFSGSGSTLIACEKTGRRCYTMELEPAYCDVIVKRWQTYTGKEAVRESDGLTFNEALQAREQAHA